MRIGLLVTSIGNFGQKKFYNAQEIGLAKQLDKIFEEVVIYKLISHTQKATRESVEGCNNTSLVLIPSKNFGINGLLNVKILDSSLDALVYFSDTQTSVPRVAKWAKKNGVSLIPYVGVLESHSTSKIKKLLINYFAKRNYSVYRKLHCLAKTPTVKERLQQLGVRSVTIAPVGLDLSLLNGEANQSSIEELKAEFGYQPQEKVVLFIGRFTAEKQPEQMIDIFQRVFEEDSSYRLLMVGRGELRASVEEKIRSMGLEERVSLLDQIPNSEIWKLYRIADCFINLNEQEIFGMAILEAMYYGCKVIASHAPGPDYILEDGVSGYLASSHEEIKTLIMQSKDVADDARKRILQSFTWGTTAERIKELLLN